LWWNAFDSHIIVGISEFLMYIIFESSCDFALSEIIKF